MLSVSTLNVRGTSGWKKKKQALKYLDESDVDITILTETKCSLGKQLRRRVFESN